MLANRNHSITKMKFRTTVLLSALFFCGIFTVSYARNFFVGAPKILRLNAEETIAIAMDGAAAALVDVSVKDYPQKSKTIINRKVELQPDKPKVLTLLLDPKDFPPNFFANPDQPKYVSLSANFKAFSKEIVIPVTSLSGYMFIQTDKPIYTPRQSVMFRIIPVSEEIRQSKEPFQLIIKNPKNITIEEKNFNEKFQKLNKAFVTHVHNFPSHPLLGEWSATVRYGHNMEHNSTVYFTVKEYVLPTFRVELTAPDVILPKDEVIDISINAKYVYGKNLQGIVNFRLGVRKPNSLTADIFGEITGRELNKGAYDLRVRTADMKNANSVGWFPRIEGSYLFVEATVVDAATGDSETATDVTGRFSTTPFVISFDRCLRDFKPGLTSVFEADITYFGGNPAKDIKTKISAVANDGKSLHIAQKTVTSNEEGKVTFEIHPEMKHKSITITLETIDEKFHGSQAKGTFVQESYKSTNNAYLGISRSTPQRLRPGDSFSKEVHVQPPQMKDIYYMVIAKGKILFLKKFQSGEFKTLRMVFPITFDMVPNFRVLVFSHYRNELIVDSLRVEVESVCHKNAEVDINPEYNVLEPGSSGKIIISGSKGTSVGLLGVDEAIYALSKRDLLTKAKLFNTLGSHDLGCGPGGGLTVQSVLGNAGITMGTNHYTPSNSVHSCAAKTRRKRDISAEDIADQYEGAEKECCLLIEEPNELNKTCQERAEIIDNRTRGIIDSCAKVFMDCCMIFDGEVPNNSWDNFGRSGSKVPIDFIIPPGTQESMIKELTVRSDFRETWLFEDIVIGPDEKEEVGASLPHSITTWVLQAVSLSPENGMCVAEPKRLESFQQIFLQLNLPYSVVRNEQVGIEATVFNYGNEKIYAYVFMYGTADLCAGTLAGEKSETVTVLVESQSAATVTFPVIPMEVKDYPIKVFAMTTKGSDAIERKLHVVPAGITKEIDIPVKLDPKNMQGRKDLIIKTEFYTDRIQSKLGLQLTTINLGAPEGFVPGTASCHIMATGDTFGPAVETSVKNPEKLLTLPHGCGEQTIMRMASTVYALNYLNASGQLTAKVKKNAVEFIRKGYSSELRFKKDDGSYSTWKNTPSITWLTAFVIKVLCQANKFVFLDQNVLCSGVKWLIDDQEADGSYVEKRKLDHWDLTGGVKGRPSLTAFVVIALSECDCNVQNLKLAQQRATAYLETQIYEVQEPLHVAIVAYALSLGKSDKKDVVINKLLALSKYDAATNRLSWPTPRSARDIETAGYALMAFLHSKDMPRCNSIVNWLNTKQLQSGAFKSTQDTVVALQALSKYAVEARTPVSLVSNITLSNDITFHSVMTFTDENSLTPQEVSIDRVGGTIYIKTSGYGQGTLTAKLSYNMIVPIEKLCKFEITVEVREVNDFLAVKDGKIRGRNLENFPIDVIMQVKNDMGRAPPGMEDVKLARQYNRNKRQAEDGTKQYALNIALCVRYLGDKEAGMSIVDVGTFSGYEPYIKDLKQLQDDAKHHIKLYETSSRGVVFYLEKVPTAEKYCFNYHVLRKFYIGNTQMSAIRVYDYYNPDESCTKFYTPKNDNSTLRTICEDGKNCECAEGGCPEEEPFKKCKDKDTKKFKENLIKAFCENYDFVWKGKLTKAAETLGNGFFNITFQIDEVVKPGSEKKDDILGKTRTLLTKESCAAPFVDVMYLIAGNNGNGYQNAKGETWYRYMLDKTSAVYIYEEDAEDSKLQRAMEHATKTLIEKGCDQ